MRQYLINHFEGIEDSGVSAGDIVYEYSGLDCYGIQRDMEDATGEPHILVSHDWLDSDDIECNFFCVPKSAVTIFKE